MSISLTQAAYERLRRDVLSCRLQPGQRLKINELCSRLQVSLGAIREALSRLTSEGLIVAAPQRGFSVAPISIDELHDLTMVRLQIEETCLRAAIRHGDQAWESRVVAALHLLCQTPERPQDDPAGLSETWLEAHAEFHAALVSSCGSPWLLRLRAQLYVQAERYRRLGVSLTRPSYDLRAEHQAIAAAILARDAEHAVNLMTRHMTTTTLAITNDRGQINATAPAAELITAHAG